eukprot:tig00001065_g6721.t1
MLAFAIPAVSSVQQRVAIAASEWRAADRAAAARRRLAAPRASTELSGSSSRPVRVFAASDPSNVWSKKPAWCQPWTIVLTGGGIIGGSWAVFHNQCTWVTGLVSLPVLAWWFLFLVLYPRAYREAYLNGSLDELD